jgi:hypothetical protein
MIFFPDTNFFLHFKDPQEIPWSAVTADDHVRLIICANTQRELDKKKFELKGRALRHARKWASIIGEILDTETPKELRPNRPRVTLELHLERQKGWSAPPELDAAVPDDAYVADVLAYIDATGNTECALLTADTGPRGKAKRHGLRALSAWQPDWELPEETDERDKKINHLEQQLTAAQKVGPAISATTKIGELAVREITVEVTRYPALTEPEIAALLAELEMSHPRATDFSCPDQGKTGSTTSGRPTGIDVAGPQGAFEWVGPTDDQIAAYSADYDKWLQEARQLARTLPGALQEDEFETSFMLELSNSGASAAEDVWFSLTATAGLLLRSPKEDDEDIEDDQPCNSEGKTKPSRLRLPPTAPRWKRLYSDPMLAIRPELLTPTNSTALSNAMRAMGVVNPAGLDHFNTMQDRLTQAMNIPGLNALRGMDHLDIFSGRDAAWAVPSMGPGFLKNIELGLPRPRDQEKFYWKNRPTTPLSGRWEFKCSLLRHHIQPASWMVPVVVELGALPKNGGSVDVEVHARNLRQPFSASIPVRVSVRDEDTQARIRALFPRGR